MTRRLTAPILAWLVLTTLTAACVAVETIPDTPSNAGIQLTGAMREGDTSVIGPLLCSTITDESAPDPTDPSTFGAMAGFYEARLRNISEGRTAFGGSSEYTPSEEVDLEVDEAWTEIEFRGEDLTEVWRLHMVRRDGRWRAYSAEQLQ